MPGLSTPFLGHVWAGVTTLGAPALRFNLRRRAGRGKEIAARLAERCGNDATPRPPGRLLWLHAASVGETMSILPVLRALADRAPDLTTLLTTGTVTSAELLGQRLPALGLQRRVLHRFAPLDVPAWVARFLDHWRPDAAGFVESELWPNQLLACQRRRIPLMLLNARISARSRAGWARVPGLARHLLSGFARIQARGPEDAERLHSLGARQVEAPGDLKLAAPPLPVDETALAALRQALTDRPVWLAASTHPGEEQCLATVHASLLPQHPGLLTIIAPRHPERGAELAAALAAPRRGAGQEPPASGIWIADTLGELGLWYRLAPVTFVGRSLLPPGGGQNPLEPARLGCAVAVGPHTDNFSDAMALLRSADAVAEVSGTEALTAWVDAMLRAPDARAAMGARAEAAVQRHADLPLQTADALLALLPAG